jgi:hypothetical protein
LTVAHVDERVRLTLQSFLESAREHTRFGFRCEEQVFIRPEPQCRARSALRCSAGRLCHVDAEGRARGADRARICAQYEARRGRQ